MLNYNKKAKLVFYQIFALGLGFSAFFLFLNYIFYIYITPLTDALWGKIDSVCGCAAHLSFLSHPWLFLLLISAGLSLLLFFGSSLLKVLRIVRSTNRFINLTLKDRKYSISSKLSRTISALGLQKNIIKIQNNSPIIFCYGLFRPKICVSTGLVKELNQAELLAVLAHEKHHLNVHEPIRLFIVKALVKILFFLPGIKALAKQYFVLSELAADEEATNNFQHKIPLARALYKIIKWKKTNLRKNGLAVSFFSDVTEERIKKLENNKKTDSLKGTYFKLSIGIFILFFSFISFNTIFNSSSLNSLNHRNGSCSAETMSQEHQCYQMSGLTCTMGYNSSNQLCT